jgi:membrane-associated phospholipid phosphatase
VKVDELPSGLANAPYPTDAATLTNELEELVMLARLRDEPYAIGHDPAGEDDPQGLRLPLSLFLQLRPQPLGAAVNTARDHDTFPPVYTGRELARYFEAEPPGIAHRLALVYMLSEQRFWSPPRQAWIWAALDVTIYSALAVAWYLKWRGPSGVRFRPRPWECYNGLDVLYDRVQNSTNSADRPRRGFPPGVQPQAARPGEPVGPEGFVPDLPGMAAPSLPTPGTPRHPAYPSGHSTYSAAATRLLIEFFPQYREQLCRLADNIGLARMWAGIHWRTDHTYGQSVGAAVAELIIAQLRATGIPRFPGAREPDEAPMDPPDNVCDPGNAWDAPARPPQPPCAEAS